MNKEIIEEMAMLYALGTLPEAEVAAFEELMRREHTARQLVHEYQRITEAAAREAAATEPSFHIYPSLMSRIDILERGATEEVKTAPSGGRLLSFAAWSGWGLAACASLALGLSIWSGGGATAQPEIALNSLANPRLVAVKTPSAEVSREDRMLELSGLAEAYWFSREGVPVDQQLADAGSGRLEGEPLSGGFTIFDSAHQIGFIAVENLPREEQGKSYHVWAKTGAGAQAVRAGALPIGNESRGLFFFDLSSLPEVSSLDQVSFFVTEESTSEPAKPGPMVVLSHF